MSTFDLAARERVLAVIAELKNEAGPLLPVLHGIQNALGYVPPDAVPLVAGALNLCRAESCQSMNGKALEAHVKSRLGIGFHQTTVSGSFTVEPVYCLGNCACS